MTITCTACGKPTSAPPIEKPHIVNLPACSVVTVQHPDVFTCEHCGAQLAHAVAHVNLQIVGVAVPPKKQQNIILVPGRAH